jgi:hypothetical protein
MNHSVKSATPKSFLLEDLVGRILDCFGKWDLSRVRCVSLEV